MNKREENTTPLTSEERSELERHEATLSAAQQSQFDAGRALQAIHDQRLYRETHDSFDDYCSDKGYTSRNARYLMGAVDVLNDLSKAGYDDLPTCVSYARPLIRLDSEVRVKLWKSLLDDVGVDAITLTEVKKVVAVYKQARTDALADDGTKEPPAVSPSLQQLVDDEDEHAPEESSIDAGDTDVDSSATTSVTREQPDAGEEAGRTINAADDEPEPSQIIQDIGILGDSPPDIEPDERGTVIVAVPSTIYINAVSPPDGDPASRRNTNFTDRPFVLTALDEFEKELGLSIDGDLIERLRDEIERLGYKPRFNPANEAIDWAKWTWNPVTGCKHGCPFCYARAKTHLHKSHFPQGFRPTIYPGRLGAPGNTPLPALDPDEPGNRRVFIDSMGDLFGPWIPDAFIIAVLEEIARHPEWTFMVLTKYPRRLPAFDFPENVWVGTSVVSQKYVASAEEAMARVCASVRWVSCEPVLTPIEFSRPEVFDLFVIGSQTAANEVPAFQPEAAWVDALRMQARSVDAVIFEKKNLEVHLRETPEPQPERFQAGHEASTALLSQGDGMAEEAPCNTDLTVSRKKG